MKRLYAGPWIGEFGWVLMGWQGVIRQLSEQFDETIILGPPGHQYLYEDFMDSYIEVPVNGKSPNMWMNDGCEVKNPLTVVGDVWIPPQRLTQMDNIPEHKFIRYGTKNEDKHFDIVYHARNQDKYGSDYINYPKQDWEKLLARFNGKKIACIGTRKEAFHVPETTDLRDLSLRDLADVLASSDVLMGPSSGPMHYGALCGIPMVVWSGYAGSRPRYISLWNPFGTPVTVIDADNDPWGNKKAWQPKLDDILEAVESIA